MRSDVYPITEDEVRRVLEVSMDGTGPMSDDELMDVVTWVNHAVTNYAVLVMAIRGMVTLDWSRSSDNPTVALNHEAA